MANIVGLNDNNLLSSASVYDTTQGNTQETINKTKLDYPDTITYSFALGQNETYGIIGTSSGTDRIHFVIPTYSGYTTIKSMTHNGGTMHLYAVTSNASSSIAATIKELTDYYVHKSGVLHIKPLLNQTLLANCGYFARDSSLVITVTLAK